MSNTNWVDPSPGNVGQALINLHVNTQPRMCVPLLLRLPECLLSCIAGNRLTIHARNESQLFCWHKPEEPEGSHVRGRLEAQVYAEEKKAGWSGG